MSFLFGGKEKSQEIRTANVRSKDYGTNQAARPVPLFWGIQKLGGTYITDLFNKSADPITQSYEAGSETQTATTGYNYRASFAQLICMGPVDELRKIYANDDVIWEGTMSRSGADANGMSNVVTTLGAMRVYWGTSTQNVDSILAAMKVDEGAGAVTAQVPAYRHFCYVVANNFFFGQSTSPPNLSYIFVRRTSGLSLSAHHLSDDAILPEVFYDLFTNKVYGVGLPAISIDEISFEDAGETTIDEDLGVSPLLITASKTRQLLGDLLPYINGAVFYQGGKIAFKLQRPAVGTVIDLGPEDLVEEPEINPSGWVDTWNETRVSFGDRARDFDDNVASYHDLANSDIVGGVVQKEYGRPYITRESVAYKIAAAIGKTGGIPTRTASLSIKSSVALVAGQSFNLAYPALGILTLPMVATRVVRGSASSPAITVEAIEDVTRLSEASYVPPDEFQSAPVASGPENALVRIAALTSDQKAGKLDGMLVCSSRPNSLVVAGQVFSSWSLSAGWSQVGGFQSYPLLVGLNRWRRYGSNLLLDITVTHDHDQSALQAFRDSLLELFIVTGVRRVARTGPVDEHQVVPTWSLLRPGGRFQLVGTNRWEIEVLPGRLGSTPIALEDLVTPADGYYPTATGFIGRVGDFQILPTDTYFFDRSGGNDPADTDQKRYVRILTATATQQEELADGATVNFDRNDTTMAPGGTYSSNWGNKASNGEYITVVQVDLPLAYWRLGEASGSTAADASGNARPGTLAGGMTLSAAGALQLDPDTAITFNGSSGWMDAGNAAAFQLSSGTVECWFKGAAPGAGTRHAIGKANAWALVIKDGEAGAYDYGTATFKGSGVYVNNGAWHHVALVFDSGVTNGSKIYVDGALAWTGTLTLVDQTLKLSACRSDGGSDYLAGSLDEVACYASKLSAGRLAAHYSAGTGAW